MKFICHVKPHEHSLHRISVDCVAGPGSKESVRAVPFSSQFEYSVEWVGGIWHEIKQEKTSSLPEQ